MRFGIFFLAEEGQALYSGQELRTGEDGSSTVRVQDSRLVLGSETHIRLGRNGPMSDLPWPSVFVLEGIVGAEIAARADGKPLVLTSNLAELSSQQGKYQFVSLPDATLIEEI